DRDEEGLDVSYRYMYEAYERIFARCGLTTRAVEADPGEIGGTANHEFMVLADAGEDEVVYCTACDYAANTEKAESAPPPTPAARAETPPAEQVATPGARTIDEVARLLGVEPARLLKTLLYEADRSEEHTSELQSRE